MAVHAEISVISITDGGSSSMSRQVAAAFEAISKTEGIRATLTPLGTQVEATSIDAVLDAVRAAHRATQSAGAARIISSIRIDQRLDKDQTLEDKVRSVNSRLSER